MARVTPPVSLSAGGGGAGELIRAVRALGQSVTPRAGVRPRHTEIVVTEELGRPRAELSAAAGLVRAVRTVRTAVTPEAQGDTVTTGTPELEAITGQH